MTLITRERLKKSNAEIAHYLGVVVDNKDPEFRGRAKIKVFGTFDEVAEADLPWAYQRFDTNESIFINIQITKGLWRKKSKIKQILEKPTKPRSNIVVTRVYFYDISNRMF